MGQGGVYYGRRKYWDMCYGLCLFSEQGATSPTEGKKQQEGGFRVQGQGFFHKEFLTFNKVMTLLSQGTYETQQNKKPPQKN